MRTFVLAALAVASLNAFAAQPLLPAGGTDQVPSRLAVLPVPAGDFERAPVSFSWRLDPSQALAPPAPLLAQSREFWQTVDAAQLRAGVEIGLSSPGALIRLSPARGAAALTSRELRLHANGKPVALQATASDVQLQAAGMDVAPGTAMARVAPGNGPGRYRLTAATADGRYVMHVFEPDSRVVLQARADRNHAVAGDTVSVAVDLSHDGRAVPMKAEALLVAPDGHSQPATVVRGRDGRLRASARMPSNHGTTPGLWELQVFATGDGVQRDARTAFAVAQPTARFSGVQSVNAAALRIALPVQAGSPGRYEARGTLYATAPDHVLRPVAQGHSAAWMQPGIDTLVLSFDRKHLPAGYGAPFEVRQLELHDQTRIAPLEVRARGLRF